jgi:hypothetical protein
MNIVFVHKSTYSLNYNCRAKLSVVLKLYFYIQRFSRIEPFFVTLCI